MIMGKLPVIFQLLTCFLKERKLMQLFSLFTFIIPYAIMIFEASKRFQ